MLNVYIKGLIDKVSKILPLSERERAGEQCFLSVYLEGILIEANGALELFPELQQSAKYITVLSKLTWIEKHSVEAVVLRREVFRMKKLLEEILTLGGGQNGC